jgi:hypothetical protein
MLQFWILHPDLVAVAWETIINNCPFFYAKEANIIPNISGWTYIVRGSGLDSATVRSFKDSIGSVRDEYGGCTGRLPELHSYSNFRCQNTYLLNWDLNIWNCFTYSTRLSTYLLFYARCIHPIICRSWPRDMTTHVTTAPWLARATAKTTLHEKW